MQIHSILKQHNQYTKLTVFKRPIITNPNISKKHDSKPCAGCFYKICPIYLLKQENADNSLKNSISRTKTKIYDYVNSNNFELFSTFTFDPKKIDSFNIQIAKQKITKWLNNEKRTSPNLKYLLVPEKHKSGAIHFHALIENYKGKITPAINPKTNKLLTQRGRQIYNHHRWKLGHSTTAKIDNKQAVAVYMQKYITKDMLMLPNKRRYLSSKNLNQPIKTYNVPHTDPEWLKQNPNITLKSVGKYALYYDNQKLLQK